MQTLIQKTKKTLASLLSLTLVLSHFSGLHALAAHDVIEIYSLATDALIQNLEIGTTGNEVVATPYLNPAGSPVLTVVTNPFGGGNSIELSNRGENWHALDLQRAALGLELGNLYTITVAGRAAAQTTFIIGGPAAPWNWLASGTPNANGEFSVELNVNHTILNDPQVASAFRLQTSDTSDFIIDEIIVNHVGSDSAWTPPPPPGLMPAPDGLVLRVETTGTNQSDGVQIPVAELGVSAGNSYEFTFDMMMPQVPTAGVGLVLQTDNPWTQITPTGILEAGEWARFTGTLAIPEGEIEFPNIQIVKDDALPNPNANVVFLLDNFTVTNTQTEATVASFDFENAEILPFSPSGDATLELVPAIARDLLHHVSFAGDWATYEEFTAPGAQMAGTRVTNFGRADDYAFRLENVTGNYTSGDGNYLRLDLPTPLRMGGTYELSWWVYVPLADNPGTRNLVGPGIVFNSTFGSPAHQPTNTQPIPDLNRTTPMNEWFQTTVVVDLDHATGSVEHLIFRFRVNNDTQQPTVYFIDDIVINSLGFDDGFAEPEWDLTLPSLAQIYEDYFFFGNILEPTLINNNPRNVIEMFLHQYNSVTAENAMKPDAISGGGLQATRPEALLLDGAETMVSFAEAHDLHMVGHTLIWHEQSALWQYLDPETGDFLTREAAMENMRWFISEYAGHFDGRIDAWDVTNEVFTNSGGANNPIAGPEGSPVYPVGSWQRALRNYASWYQAFANGADFEAGERGFDYIYYSFVFARTYAPSATLIYNDFNDEMPLKRNAMASMVEEFNERWANDDVNNPAYDDPNHPDYGRLLIEAIGMQAHYNQSTNLEHVRDSLDRFIETGARIHITELDIQFHNPAAPFELSEAQLQQQADMFAQLFRWYVERAEHIDRVTIWGREDGTSWRGQNGATHFDRNYNPKPAFWAIVDPFGHIGEDWPGAPEPSEPLPTEVIFNLRDYLAYASGGIGEGHFDFSVTDRIQPAGPAVFTVVDRGGANYLAVTGRTADWHAIDIVREGLQVGDTITVIGRTVQAATVALDGAEAPHPWWYGQAVAANSDYELTVTLTEDDLINPGLVRFRLRTRGTEDFYVYNILITRTGGTPGDGDNGGDVPPPTPADETLVWSLADESNLQALAPGHSGIGDYFDDFSEAMIVSGTPLITVVEHPTATNQIGLQLSERSENWHALDFMFPGLGVERGGTYRFVARGRIAEGTGNRNIVWNQTDAPWQAFPNASTVVPGNVTTWEVEVTLNRYEINTALNAGQRGVRLQTGNAPTVTLTVDDVFVYQVGDLDTEGLPLPPEWDLTVPRLADLFAPYFGIGNIYSTHSLMDAFDTRSAFLHHFNVLTAENGHKPDHIAGPGNRFDVPTPEEFDFTGADQIIDFAVENDIQLVGHALVWHGQSPNWLFMNPDGSPLARSEALYRMEYYMRTLSEHFAAQGTLGAFYSWDVVNEAIASGGGTWTGDWREQMRTASPWFAAFGNGLDVEAGEHASDFIWYAFYFARQYFPYSILYYNDYNEEIPAKRNAIAQMVEQINERWVNHPSYDGRLLIEAIGMQSHYHLTGWTTNFDNVSAALDRFIETGARVSVTELDITYGGHGAPAFPYLTEAQLQAQAEAYARVFGYYLERANYLSRVSIWGMADHKSWRGSGFPLLFDSSFTAKPAFDAIVELVESWETPTVAPPTINTTTLASVEDATRIFTLLDVTSESNAPVWFEVVDGNLPAGVNLHTRTGILEGTPTENGTFTFTIAARNYGGTTTQPLTITVGYAEAIDPPPAEDLVEAFEIIQEFLNENTPANPLAISANAVNQVAIVSEISQRLNDLVDVPDVRVVLARQINTRFTSRYMENISIRLVSSANTYLFADQLLYFSREN